MFKPEQNGSGRSSDLLLFLNAFPSACDSGRMFKKINAEITAAGTVQVLHLVPFSFRLQEVANRNQSERKYTIYFKTVLPSGRINNYKLINSERPCVEFL